MHSGNWKGFGGKLQDVGDRDSSVEYQSLDAPGEKRQQEASALTLMGGSLPKEEVSCVSQNFLWLQVLKSVTDGWARRQQEGLRFQSCLGTSW